MNLYLFYLYLIITPGGRKYTLKSFNQLNSVDRVPIKHELSQRQSETALDHSETLIHLFVLILIYFHDFAISPENWLPNEVEQVAWLLYSGG